MAGLRLGRALFLTCSTICFLTLEMTVGMQSLNTSFPETPRRKGPGITGTEIRAGRLHQTPSAAIPLEAREQKPSQVRKQLLRENPLFLVGFLRLQGIKNITSKPSGTQNILTLIIKCSSVFFSNYLNV
uniref:Uncharacterized protein n=1 Tax=Pipistrellus kuhlii TaxID=59472 RepID=A0A7J7TKW8_PIPKU|nr:hypothetical protein mPipKuh1_009338 [Pipistrellus kuhlii]